MNPDGGAEIVLPDIKVPVSLLRCPDRFGGQRKQDCLLGDLVVRDGRALQMMPASGNAEIARIVLPKLTECHVHLDKCHTISRMNGVGGDLKSAIEAQAADRENWSPGDIRARAKRGLDELIAAGCGNIRSHIDWGCGASPMAPSPAWSVLCELAQDYQSLALLQLAPLVGANDLANRAAANAVGRQISATGGVLGVFVLDQPDRRLGVRHAFEFAERYGLALDFHVDEGLADGLDGLEIIADTAIETGFAGPILCGHACSLMNTSSDAFKALADKMLLANISVVCLPASNLYLQGRTSGTPDRRGITRVHELRAAGIPVVIGTDNVRDAFTPLGRHDPRHSLALATLTAHLDPPFGDYLSMITTCAEMALGLAPTYVDGAAIGDLILFDDATTADFLAGTTPPRPLLDLAHGEPV